MLKLVFYVIVLALAIVVGLLIKNNPGYALFAYQHWTVEMPLWTAVLLEIIGFIIFYSLVRLISFLLGSGSRFQQWLTKRQRNKSYNLTNQGMIAFIEGHWQDAERLLKQGIKSSNFPLMNYLTAAYAAQEQGNLNKRDHYMHAAWQQFPEEKFAIGLTQAKLQLQQQQLELALASLNQLYLSYPKHPQVLKLLYVVYFKLQDWRNLAGLIQQLRKQKIISVEELIALEIKITQEKLTKASNDLSSLNHEWKELSSELKKQPEILLTYCKYLLKFSEADKIAQLITDYLDKNWHDELVEIYGQINSSQPNKQLVIAEKWLSSRSENATLLLALGRLAIRNHLWGKAKDYLSASIKINKNPIAYQELAMLNEQLNDKNTADRLYREGLAIVMGKEN